MKALREFIIKPTFIDREVHATRVAPYHILQTTSPIQLLGCRTFPGTCFTTVSELVVSCGDARQLIAQEFGHNRYHETKHLKCGPHAICCRRQCELLMRSSSDEGSKVVRDLRCTTNATFPSGLHNRLVHMGRPLEV